MLIFDPDMSVATTGDAVVVNTVNTVGVMGAGVAKAVRERWPEIMEPYTRACRNGRFIPGTLHLFETGGGQLVVNMATKRDWRQPSQLSWAGAGLVFLSKLLQNRGRSSDTVTLPPPGCGHGGLDMATVQGMIRAYMAPSIAAGVRVTVSAQEVAIPDREPVYAGVGARATPDRELDRMSAIAGLLETRGFLMRSGGARGADSAFAAGVSDPARMEIFVADERGLRANPGSILNRDPLHFRMVPMVHPAAGGLSPAVHALMARNGCQVFGEDFSRPSDVVICWTKDGAGTGGTGQAIRLARTVGIPVIDMGLPEVAEMSVQEIVDEACRQVAGRRAAIGCPLPANLLEGEGMAP